MNILKLILNIGLAIAGILIVLVLIAATSSPGNDNAPVLIPFAFISVVSFIFWRLIKLIYKKSAR